MRAEVSTTSARERDRLRLARQLQTAPLVALMRRAPVPKMTHKPYASWWILQANATRWPLIRRMSMLRRKLLRLRLGVRYHLRLLLLCLADLHWIATTKLFLVAIFSRRRQPHRLSRLYNWTEPSPADEALLAWTQSLSIQSYVSRRTCGGGALASGRGPS